MKKVLISLLALVFLPLLSFTQVLEPVKWSFSVEQSAPGEATLLLISNADKGWHVYSQDIPKADLSPPCLPLRKKSTFELVGKVREPKGIEEHDPQFENMLLKYFENKAIFKQKINILTRKDFVIKGVVNFMCCDDHRCIPPTDVDFEFHIKGIRMQQNRCC